MTFLETANSKPNCKQQTAAASIFAHCNFGQSIDIVSSQLYVCHILVSKKCQLQAGTIHPRPLA